MMRVYPFDDEERLSVARRVRDWSTSGLLTAGEERLLLDDLIVGLRRTNVYLRATLGFFTALIVATSVAFVATFFDLDNELVLALLAAAAAAASFAAANYVAATLRCYRFGVEEALAVASVGLFAAAALLLVSWAGGNDRLQGVLGLFVAGIAALGVYGRFGFVYAACGGIAALAMIPFPLAISSAVERGTAALILTAAALAARALRRTHPVDHRGGEYTWIQAFAAAGIYVALNVQLFAGAGMLRGWPYWASYAAIWLLPVMTLAVAVRSRERPLIDVGMAMAIATLLTNKQYLGWPAHSWDPIALGVLLIAVAWGVRRWLSSGPGGERHGYTAVRLLESDRERLAVAGNLSVVIPHHVPAPAAEPSSPFAGGGSGGGGGGAAY
jgi:hypothetical protein